MTTVPEEGGFWTPDFQDDWPDIVPIGTWVVRSMTIVGDPDEIGAEEGLSWTITFARGNANPRHALLGELSVRQEDRIAAITVVTPFALRNEPDEMTDQGDLEFLRRYGVWASSFMYDYAAAALRSNLAGSGLNLEVQWATPTAKLPQLGL